MVETHNRMPHVKFEANRSTNFRGDSVLNKMFMTTMTMMTTTTTTTSTTQTDDAKVGYNITSANHTAKLINREGLE